MRLPSEMPQRSSSRRPGVILLILAATIIVVLIVVNVLGGIYTDFLWFHWTGLGEVWREVAVTKTVLEVVFFLVAFGLLFSSLFLVDRVVAKSLFVTNESEFVRHYRQNVGRFSRLIEIGVAFIVSLMLAAGTSGQWQHW